MRDAVTASLGSRLGHAIFRTRSTLGYFPSVSFARMSTDSSTLGMLASLGMGA